MDLIELNKKYLKLTKEREKTKGLLVNEINRLIKPIFKKTFSDYYNIDIRIIKVNKDLCNVFAGMRCIEVWETNDDEYANSCYFPVSLLKITNEKTLKNKYKEIVDNYYEKEKKRKEEADKIWKIKNKEREKKEYLRLKRKFNKNKCIKKP